MPKQTKLASFDNDTANTAVGVYSCIRVVETKSVIFYEFWFVYNKNHIFSTRNCSNSM